MDFLRLLKIFFGRSSSPRRLVQSSGRQGADLSTSGDFSADYNEAMMMLNQRINTRFPDNYQAEFNPNREQGRDYGDDRAAAIDTASATVAAALRGGATVKQAAEAGASSISI
ncbi:MAG: hypothetical protein EOO77_02605 [Oxalobacteraceae bacterium]|nr:MAG: hypothetical protein EOO77_02605 [Oxalobacteraceae bacterium]